MITKLVIFVTFLVSSVAEEHSRLGFLGTASLRADQPTGGDAGGVLPPPGDVNVKWKDESDMPKFVQWTFAGLWVGMLALIPVAIPLIDGKPPTRSQKIVAGLMILVLFGGFYLFTNIILFQSIHFKQIRSLTTVECIYFMAQVITTVGYGDITPAKVRGQVFVGMYVIGALFVISMLISDLTNVVVNRAKDYRQKLLDQRAQDQNLLQPAEPAQDLEGPTPRTNVQQSLAQVRRKKPSMQPLLTALAIFACLDVCWVMFFSMHPNEGKDMFQAFYMSVITLSSVGFGYFTPVTEHGMVFGAFWMLFGCAALVNVITNFTELMVELNEWERHGIAHPDTAKSAYNVLKNDVLEGKETLTELEFLKFSLIQMKRMDKKELADVTRAFQALSPKDGAVSLRAIADSLEINEDEKEVAAK